MSVGIKDLEGFGFIYQPTEFDAAFCSGRCPPRYHPLNDHSLLQSLMHLKSKKAAKVNRSRGMGSGKAKIKNPCCAPSQFENMDILHLDELDPTKLRVTNWKNIIVSECACSQKLSQSTPAFQHTCFQETWSLITTKLLIIWNVSDALRIQHKQLFLKA